MDVDDHTLSNLVKHFNIPLKPSHRALDDVHATTALLIALVPPCISEGSVGRMQVVQKTGAPFVPLAEEIEAMRQLAEKPVPMNSSPPYWIRQD